jgi:hypothetical protein
MGVHQRIPLPGRPVVEPDRRQALAGHMLDTAMATPGPQVLVQIGHRLGQHGVMSLEHRPAGHRVAQAVEDGDALGRPQDHIEGGHGVTVMRTAEQFASGGVAAFEHGLEPGRRCFALQAELSGAGAVPPA